MRARLFASTLTFITILAAGPVLAQDKGLSGTSQPPARQSAPSDSSHAAGHDAQTGRPETGEVQNTQPQAGTGQTKGEAETMGGASAERLDVPPSETKR
jgi:hypothetical protein